MTDDKTLAAGAADRSADHATTTTQDASASNAAADDLVLPEIPKQVTFTLGGQPFTVHTLPWGRCKKVVARLASVGAAMAAGGGHSEKTQDDVIQALSIALDMPVPELEQLPVEPIEVNAAVNELIRVTGMDRYQMAEFARMRKLAKQFAETPQALRTITELINLQQAA